MTPAEFNAIAISYLRRFAPLVQNSPEQLSAEFELARNDTLSAFPARKFYFNIFYGEILLAGQCQEKIAVAEFGATYSGHTCTTGSLHYCLLLYPFVLLVMYDFIKMTHDPWPYLLKGRKNADIEPQIKKLLTTPNKEEFMSFVAQAIHESWPINKGIIVHVGHLHQIENMDENYERIARNIQLATDIA